MNPWRAALLGGLLYGLAYGAWLLAGMQPGPEAPDLVPAHRALLWAQTMALVLLLPAIAQGAARPPAPLWQGLGLSGYGAPLLLVAVPWPLLTLPALTGSVPVAALTTGQAAVAVWGVLLLWLWSALPRLLPAAWRSWAQGLVQAAALIAAISGFPPALGVFGL